MRSVFSLKYLSARRVVWNIVEGQSLDHPLPEEPSNMIFDILSARPRFFSTAINENLTVTEMDLTIQLLGDGLINRIRMQRFLRKLVMKFVYFDERYLEQGGVRIGNVLRDMTNEASRLTLKHLDFTAADGNEEFANGWVDTIGELLPNLESLVIEHCTLGNSAPTFENFKHLKCLDASSINAQDLSGLANLEQLEVLKLQDVDLEYKGIDFRRLKNLRVLDVSLANNEEFKNIEVLVRNLTSSEPSEPSEPPGLPRLQFINCNNTDIERTTLLELLKHCPSLQQISLLGTILNSSDIAQELQVIAPHPHLKTILNCGTLESSLNSLRFFHGNVAFFELMAMMDSIQRKLQSCSTMENVQLVNEFLDELLKVVMENFHMTEVVEKTSRVLVILCSDSNIDLLDTAQIQRILNAYQSYYLRRTISMEDGGEIHLNFWRILNNPKLLQNLPSFKLNLGQLVDLGSALLWEEIKDFEEKEDVVLRVLRAIFEKTKSNEQVVRKLAEGCAKIGKMNMNMWRGDRRFLEMLRELEVDVRGCATFRRMYMRRWTERR